MLFFLLLAGTRVSAQAPEQDCINGIRVCNYLYTQTNSYVGTGFYPAELTTANQGCLASGERNDVWYIVNVTTSGTLGMTITPVNPADDYDFAVWDITGVGCSAIFNYTTNTANNYPPIGCNFSGLTGPTGLSNTFTGAQWSPVLNVTPGMTLAVNVSNFSQTSSGYTLDFGPSTASIFDTVKPRFLKVNSECQFTGSKLNVTMTEPINCNSITPDGSQFYITTTGIQVIGAAGINCTGTGPNIFTNSVSLQLNGTLPPGTYWLHSKPGTAGAIVDGCGNSQSTTADSIQFTLFPDDPPKMIFVDTPACRKAKIYFDRGIKCSTVAYDGSDFYITGPGNVTILGAHASGCDTLGMTDTVNLLFQESILEPGVYTIHVKIGTDTNSVTDSCHMGVVNTVSFVVSDQGYVTSLVSPSLLCEPGYVNLNASLTVPTEAVFPGFIWTSSEYVLDSTNANTTAYVSESRTFVVRIKDTFECYRRAKSDVIVSVRYPKMLQGDTAICTGKNVFLKASGGTHYFWYPAAGLSCTSCADPVANPTTTTTYHVVISDQYGCADTLATTVTIYPLPILSVTPDTTITYGVPLQLYALAPGGKFFRWDPTAVISNANVPNPVVTPQATTRYTVYVTDTNQCVSIDSVNVNVRINVPVQVPNAFTPNGDGNNDKFRVANVTFQKVIEFRVFNRWGQEVFQAQNNNGWDGTWNGVAQDANVYKYIARVAYPDGHTETFKGDVVLIR